MGKYRRASKASGSIMGGAPSAGGGHERSVGEKTPLLAMLPTSERELSELAILFLWLNSGSPFSDWFPRIQCSQSRIGVWRPSGIGLSDVLAARKPFFVDTGVWFIVLLAMTSLLPCQSIEDMVLRDALDCARDCACEGVFDVRQADQTLGAEEPERDDRVGHLKIRIGEGSGIGGGAGIENPWDCAYC